jgi:hypothetical protein
MKPQRVTRDVHGTGDECWDAYDMPVNTDFPWSSITDVPCPVDGCGQMLVWYEAGYVPGYRVCMARYDESHYDPATLRHRFVLDSDCKVGQWRLIRDRCCEGEVAP